MPLWWCIRDQIRWYMQLYYNKLNELLEVSAGFTLIGHFYVFCHKIIVNAVDAAYKKVHFIIQKMHLKNVFKGSFYF